MKLRALLAVIAIAATGTAFAATQTTTTTTTTTRHNKVVKKVKKTHRQTQHVAASRHHARRMGASSEHMSATPDTDLTARERQRRVDEAYEKWHSTNR